MVQTLSGGELQRKGISSLCLGKPADVYLIKEPSAYLDSGAKIDMFQLSNYNILAYKCIKRSGFVVLADKCALHIAFDYLMI